MPEIPSGSVIITPDDMWRTIQETRDIAAGTAAAVNELKGMVNPALNDLRDDLRELAVRHNEDQKENKVRLTDLEHQSWSTRWVPAVIMAVGGSGVAVILSIIITRTI